MSTKTIEKINRKTGNKVTTITNSGDSTRIRKSLKKSDGIICIRFRDSEKIQKSLEVRRTFRYLVPGL